MSILGVLGVVLGLLALFFSPIDKSERRLMVFFLAYIAHIAGAVTYYLWAQNNVVDAQGYYYDPFDWYNRGYLLSTYSIIWMVQFTKQNFGGTFLDFFLVFQAFGFWGIALLLRTFEEIFLELGVPQPTWTYALAFLPGMHFWTSMIGKDALLFLASSMVLWGAVKVRQRWPWFAAGIAIMLIIRPHIAVVAVAALAGAAILGANVKAWTRAGMIVTAMIGFGIAIIIVPYSFSIDLRSVASITEFLKAQSEVNYRGAPGESLIDLPYPVRIASFLFRPLFFDVRDAFGLIASFENLFLLIIISWTAVRFKVVNSLVKHALFVRFALLFVIGTTLLLSYVYYNVGLGLRQRTMIMPGFLAVVMSVVAIGQAQRLRLKSAASEPGSSASESSVSTHAPPFAYRDA